jgi:DNA-binding LacI/PurR family transcriptional regulator
MKRSDRSAKDKPLAGITRNHAYEEIAERIREFISDEELWGRHLAPEGELAAMFGVGRDTVRKSLQVLQQEGVIIKRQGRLTLVSPTASGKGGAHSGRLMVCTLEEGTRSAYHSEIIRGFVEPAGERSWLTSFCNAASPAGRDSRDAMLESGKIDGVVLLNEKQPDVIHRLLAAHDVPMVLVDFHFDDLPVTSIMDDCEGGARKAVTHLIELGHRRIGYLDTSKRELNPWRFAGYADALRDSGIEVDKELVVPCYYGFEAGLEAGNTLMRLSDPPTAVFAFEDGRAWGMWRAAENHGLQVGKDFALAGYGDLAALTGFGAELTTVSYNPADIGRAAFRELMARRENPTARCEAVWLPNELLIRDSSREAYGPAWPGGESQKSAGAGAHGGANS